MKQTHPTSDYDLLVRRLREAGPTLSAPQEISAAIMERIGGIRQQNAPGRKIPLSARILRVAACLAIGTTLFLFTAETLHPQERPPVSLPAATITATTATGGGNPLNIEQFLTRRKQNTALRREIRHWARSLYTSVQ